MTTEAAPELAYDISVCLHCAEIEPQAFDWGSGAKVLPLRRTDDGALRSGVAQLEAGWRLETAERPSANLQIFVLTGALDVGGRRLGRHGFAVLPAGCAGRRLAAEEPTTAIVIFDAAETRPAGGETPAPVILEDAWAMEAITPVIDGRPLAGFERRTLWVDPATGADTRLLRAPAGFSGAGPNWHPVNEEIFCLEGDVAPDDTRPMRAGSFLWNPARSIHGFNEASRGGCALLEWHDGPWALTRV